MRYFFLLFSCVLLLVFVSCFPVQRLAYEFEEHKQKKNILIRPPSKANIFYSYYPYDPDKYHNNDTIYDIEESNFLKHINDSILHSLFLEGFVDGMEKYNVNFHFIEELKNKQNYNNEAYVFSIPQLEMLEYPEKIKEGSDSVYVIHPDDEYAYIFSIGQLEMMEYPDTFDQRATYDTIMYIQEFERNNVVSNTWVEYTDIHTYDEPIEVLFSMQYTSDIFDGYFQMDMSTGEVKYEYTPYKIDLNDVYDLGYFSGYMNAEYIVDYLFNHYLKDNLGEESLEHYYRYDHERRNAVRANDDRFIIMDP